MNNASISIEKGEEMLILQNPGPDMKVLINKVRYRIAMAIAGVSGVTDHGSLGGLADDDHDQYYNESRLSSYLSAYSQIGHTHDGVGAIIDPDHADEDNGATTGSYVVVKTITIPSGTLNVGDSIRVKVNFSTTEQHGYGKLFVYNEDSVSLDADTLATLETAELGNQAGYIQEIVAEILIHSTTEVVQDIRYKIPSGDGNDFGRETLVNTVINAANTDIKIQVSVKSDTVNACHNHAFEVQIIRQAA